MIGPGRLFAQAPGVAAPLRFTEAHAAETEPRDLEAGRTKLYVLHSDLLLPLVSCRFNCNGEPTLGPGQGEFPKNPQVRSGRVIEPLAGR